MRKALDNITSFILHYSPVVLAFLIPLFFHPAVSDIFNLPKTYLLSFLASLSLISWCLHCLLHKKVTLTLSPSLIPLTLLALAFAISSVWLSPIPRLSLFGSTTVLVSLTIIFFTSTSISPRSLPQHLLLGTITSSTLLSLITIFHRLGLLTLFSQPSWLATPYFNPSGGLITALAVTIPVIIGTISYLTLHKHFLTRLVLSLAVLIMSFGGAVNLHLLLQSQKQSQLLLLPLKASWSISVDNLKNWRTALLGSGPDTFPMVYTRLKPKYLNQDPLLWQVRFPESGSLFLTFLTTSGLVGAIAFALTFLRPLIKSVRHFSSYSQEGHYHFFSTSLLTIFLSLLFFPAGISALSLSFVFLIGLTSELKQLGIIKSEDLNLTLSIRQSGKESFVNQLLPWIVSSVSLATIISYWYFAIPVFQASIYSKQAESLIKSNPVGAYLKEVNASKLDRFNTSYPLSLSQFFKSLTVSLLTKPNPTADDKKNATDYMQKSIDYAKQAAQTNPADVVVWENLANIYQTYIGSADGAHNFAVSHLAQAISLDPLNPELRLRLGLLFYNLGDTDQGIKLVGQAIDLKQNWDLLYYNLSAMYKSKKDYPRALQYLRLGMQYTRQDSDIYPKVLDELKNLEQLTASSSATTK